MSKLTIKQTGFAADYVLHGDASRAYRDNYNAGKMKPKTVNETACTLLKNPKVATRVEELRKESKQRVEVAIDQKRAWLKQVIERSLQYEQATDSEGNAIGDFKFDGKSVISAISELNRMDGDHAPTKSTVKAEVVTEIRVTIVDPKSTNS